MGIIIDIINEMRIALMHLGIVFSFYSFYLIFYLQFNIDFRFVLYLPHIYLILLVLEWVISFININKERRIIKKGLKIKWK